MYVVTYSITKNVIISIWNVDFHAHLLRNAPIFKHSNLKVWLTIYTTSTDHAIHRGNCYGGSMILIVLCDGVHSYTVYVTYSWEVFCSLPAIEINDLDCRLFQAMETRHYKEIRKVMVYWTYDIMTDLLRSIFLMILF